MFFKDKKVIGLDIGTSTIKIAELDITKSGAVINSFGYMQTPANMVTGGEISDTPAVGAVVRNIIADMGTKRKKVCAGLWGMAVIVKKITIPRIDEKLIKDQLRFEAEQYIPFAIDNIALSHHVLGSSTSPDTMDILLVAAQNELVAQYTTVIENARLECEILDVSGFALANCFEFNYGRIPGANIGIMNIGASVTNFVVISNGEVVFTRDIPAGGINYTMEIHKGMGVSVGEAEALKIGASTRKDVPEDVLNIIASTNEVVGDEIRNSLDFLSATAGGLQLNKCFVTGGASPTPGLMETIGRVSGVQVEQFNPFARMTLNTKSMTGQLAAMASPIAAVAVGLGLREGGGK